MGRFRELRRLLVGLSVRRFRLPVLLLGLALLRVALLALVRLLALPLRVLVLWSAALLRLSVARFLVR